MMNYVSFNHDKFLWAQPPLVYENVCTIRTWWIVAVKGIILQASRYVMLAISIRKRMH